MIAPDLYSQLFVWVSHVRQVFLILEVRILVFYAAVTIPHLRQPCHWTENCVTYLAYMNGCTYATFSAIPDYKIVRCLYYFEQSSLTG